MRATFLHMADCHLGKRQYNNRRRQNDFTRAYLDIIDAAIAREVDFVLLAGDLFEKRTIDPLTLVHAISGLERLREAGIPCLAVEGNHERAYYRDSFGWMRFLAEQEMLTLLSLETDEEAVVLRPYERRKGAYVEPVEGLRVYGMGYYGSMTAHVVKQAADALEAAGRQGVDYTIFMAHAGVEGVVDRVGGAVSHRELAPLRRHVDYLALGHIHKNYEFENWIFNPGSPETNSLREVQWTERGYFLVEVDTEAETKHRAQLFANARRSFETLSFKVDACETPVELFAQCQQFVERRRRQFKGDEPVVVLRLSGVLAFDRSALTLAPLEQMIDGLYNPLHCTVRDETRAAEFEVDTDRRHSRPALERQIIAGLLERDSRFRARSSEWTELTLAIKHLAVSGASAEAILEEAASGGERILQEEGRQC